MAFKLTHVGPVTVHGNGAVGGKGEGLLALSRASMRTDWPANARIPTTHILSSELYSHFKESGDRLDQHTLALLKELHASCDSPIAVRPSEANENNPFVATSGANTSFMLPNNHPDSSVRFGQLAAAVTHAFVHFDRTEGAKSGESMAVVLSPIPGVFDDTPAGPFFYPMSSGVADSYMYYPLGGRKPEEGFARIAFGHGYATVRDDFPVVPLLTISNPVDPKDICAGQRYFYAIDMRRNSVLEGWDMETMGELAIRHASASTIAHFGNNSKVDFSALVACDSFGYMSTLRAVVAALASSSRFFQIEYTFNVLDGQGIFHLVQHKLMPDLESSTLVVPEDQKHVYVSTDQVQGNGSARISTAVVISPAVYTKSQHGEVRSRLRELNSIMAERGERYLLVCPGRLGTSNSDWGIYVEFKDISSAAAIVEYGFDIKGSGEIALTPEEITGGREGSHFLAMIRGAVSGAERERQVRLLGSQGTHFLTNLVNNGTIYAHVNPMLVRDEGAVQFDRNWFFSPSPGLDDSPIYVKQFDPAVTVYADLANRRCIIK